MKKLLAIIMVLAVLLSLVGCKKTDVHRGNIPSPTVSKPADEVVLDTEKEESADKNTEKTDDTKNISTDYMVNTKNPTNKKEENKTSSTNKKPQENNEKPTENKTEEKTEEKTEKPKEEPIEKKEIKTIVDESHKYLKTGNIVKFYEKDFFGTYFTVSGENDGIIIYFEDGTTMGVVEAFQKKMVTLSDLDKFGVKYIKDYSRSFFDLTEHYDCDVENKTQEFYRDENFSYFFPSQKDDYVKYVDKNGKTMLASEALKKGIIKHYDLGNFIDFDKKYIGNKLLIVNESEGYGTTQAFEEFYRDETYIYYFSDGRTVVVYYPDGTRQGVTEALKEGKIKVTDLKKFGIKYYTNADLKK